MTEMIYPIRFIDHDTSLRLDVLAFAFAIALHVPFYFMKFDVRKHSLDRLTNRLVAIDMIDEEALKKEPVPPPPPVVDKTSSIFEKLKALVRKEPPPPVPVKKEIPKDLDMGPKQIKLEPKLSEQDKLQPKLQTKSGFQTTVDPNLVMDKKIALKGNVSAIAPVSAGKLGTVTDRSQLKSDRGKFEMSSNEKIQSIDDGGPKLADAAAPAVAIRVGKGKVEQFSAPPPQMVDKGKLGGVNVGTIGEDKKMGLRDTIIARDAAPTMIAMNKGGTRTGAGGDEESAMVATKKDAGKSFQAGSPGGLPGVAGGGIGATAVSMPKIEPVKPKKEKKSMFVITGPLKDRKVESRILPEYPDWAIAEGIEASVVLEFTVTPEGHVKDAIVVRRSSGYPKLDEASKKALLKWKFVSLEENREEVGTITFNYTLE